MRSPLKTKCESIQKYFFAKIQGKTKRFNQLSMLFMLGRSYFTRLDRQKSITSLRINVLV